MTEGDALGSPKARFTRPGLGLKVHAQADVVVAAIDAERG